MKRTFLFEYLKNIREVGAIAPSSKYLATKMVEEIEFRRASIIVELGSGTGAFTDEIIRRRRSSTKVLIVENNQYFVKELRWKYGACKNVYISDASAEDLTDLLRQHGLPEQVDYIVSGLPFASLPKSVSETILNAAKQHTKQGVFITFQYTLFKKKMLEKYFSDIKILWEPRNIPPAYVLVATNKKD